MKNYLTEKEIKKLERSVTGFFDYVENIIENRNTFTMHINHTVERCKLERYVF